MGGLWSVISILGLGLAFATAAAADPQLYEGRRIATILFVPPEQPLDAEEIYRLMPLRVNRPLHLVDVRMAIDRLFATGHYTDIQVDAELRDNGVVLRFLTAHGWFVGRVAVEGNAGEPPNPGQLIAATRLQLGEPYVEEKTRAAVAGIKDVLEDNGFHGSQVEPRFDYDPRTQQIRLRFQVTSGKRARLAPPRFAGTPKLPAAQVIAATRWKGWFGWRPLTQNRLQRGLQRIRALHQAQDRLMARVSTASLDYDPSTGSVTPTLQVEAGPKVEVRAVGAKVARGRLTRLIPIYEEKTVDRDLLVEGERNLRDYFQSQGYFNAEVVHKQQRVINDRAVIDYLINLGRRHKLVKVEIAGNHYFDTATLRERLFIAPASLQYRRGRYSEGLRRRDEQAIADLYRENGFRDVQVTSTVIDNYQGKPDNLAVGLQVVEGPQSFVARLEVEGIRQLPRETIVGALSSAEGQPFSEFNVAVDRDNILARYFNEGFPNAAFEWNVTPAEAPNQVDLRFTITEGERRFVRQVLVSGLETTQPGLVNRNLHLGPGDPLSLTRMADAQRRLYDLGVFARVNMAIQNPDGETQSKYVLYQIEEARKYSVSAGAGAELGRIGGGVSSFENPAGQAGFSPRLSFNVSRLNVNGLGHTLSFKSRVSNLQQRGLINYSAPRLRNVAGLNLSFTALYDKSRDVRTFTAQRLEGSVQLSQRLSKATSSLYRFSFRRVRLADLKINQLKLPPLARPVRIGMLSGNLIQDRRDDPIDSRKGVYNTVDLGVASRVFGSEANFTRFLGRNSTYRPLGKNVVLARSLNLGWLNPFRLGGTFGDIPLSERLFSGGASSHRGFPDNQAGPRDDSTGFPLGGRALFIHNTEARFPVIGDNLAGVVFHDAGNVYSKLENLSFRVTQRARDDFDYMVHAVGLGVRYRTPVGPLRLDLAYSLNGPRFCGATAASRPGPPCGTRSDERISRFQFHFSIGQAF